jgi:hypothetical protein
LRLFNRLVDGILERALGLAVKEVRHRGHSIKLVLLVRVELKFHAPEIVSAGVRERTVNELPPPHVPRVWEASPDNP